eukprot:SAG31_NODE_5403_length_2556_cov_8.128060_2_plen_85_part_00
MVASFGLQDGNSWVGVPEAIAERLHAHQGDRTSVQDRLITAALESINDHTPADKKKIKQLFSLFALVPEDVSASILFDVELYCF